MSTKQFYFISGLPRSGTTLLSAILQQNPKFYASISSPVARVIDSTVECLSHPENKVQCTDDIRRNIARSIINAYYEHLPQEVVFDTNRGWVANTSMLTELYPATKIIVCVRDIAWILDSFEILYRKNLYTRSTLYSGEERLTAYTRCNTLMRDNGLVGYAYACIKEILSLPEKSIIKFVEYEDLCKNPEATLRGVYEFIDQPFFKHNFDNVEYSNDEFDAVVGTPGLHTTRKSISWTERKAILPPDIFRNFIGAEVWRPSYPGSFV